MPAELFFLTVERVPVLAFGFSPGYQELLIVGIIALLLFGKRLPEVARNLGKGFSEFKKGMSGVEKEIRSTASAARNIDYESSSTDSRPPVEGSAADEDTDDEFTAPRFEMQDN